MDACKDSRFMKSRLVFIVSCGLLLCLLFGTSLVAADRPSLMPPGPPSCSNDSECQRGYYCRTFGEGPTHLSECRPNQPNEGAKCYFGTDCYSGLTCHSSICTKEVSGDCSGTDDKSCAAGYTCTQKCGPPVARLSDNTPPGYECLINEPDQKQRVCPIR
jgi:hypothetical protein